MLMKKLLTLVVCSLLAIWTVSASQYTMSGTFKNGGTWKVEKGVLYVDAETIPNSPNTRPAARTNLAGGQSNAWENMSDWWGSSNSIRTIELSSKVKKIGNGAFAGCVNLEKVVFKAGNNNNVEIGDEAFSDCWRLTDFDFSRVTVIGENAFDRCRSLKRIELPVIQSIGRNAFCECASLWLEDGGIVLSGNTIPSGLNNMVVTKNPYGAVSSTDANGKTVRILTLSGWLKVIVPPAKLPSYISTYAKSYTWGLIFLGGDGWKWYFDDTRKGMEKLYIFANYYKPDGIPDFESETDQPWYSFRDKIRWVEIYNVTPYGYTIGKNAFKGSNIYSIDVHNSFISWINVGESAFEGCSRFTRFDQMANARSVGKRAFANTCLTKADLSKAETIGDNAFDGCNINNITFGSISSIGQYAFRGAFANGGEIYVSTSVPTTAGNAFSGAKTVNTILHVGGEHVGGYMTTVPWSSFQLDQSKIFPISGTWGIGYGTWMIDSEGTLIVKGGKSFDQKLPDYANESDQPWYLYRNYIKRVIIEEGLQGIGKNAFATPNEGESQIAEVVVPASVETIGENAFKNNDQIEEVVAEGVKNIGSQAFENCSSMEQVKFGKNLSSIGSKAFNYCGLVDVMTVKSSTPPAVTAQTFVGLGRISNNAPAKAKAKYAARRAQAATGQKAVSLDVPDDYIAKYLAAQYWNLFSFEFIGEHGGIVRSGQYYDGVWVIYEDGTLIASSETSTGNIDGFYNDATVKRVELMGGATELTWTGFAATDLPNVEEIVLSPAMHKLGNEVFKGLTKLKNINLENVDSIGQNCFKGCTALKNINLSAVKFIDNNAFEGCSALTDVNITGNGAKLRNFLFKNCTGLKRVELVGLDPTYTPGGAFNGCTALESVKLEGTAMTVGESMFKDCSALSVVSLGSDCRSVGSKAFANTGVDTIYASSPTPASLSADAFENVTLANIHVRVPADYIRIYKKANIWKEMDILADPAYGEPMLPVGGMMNTNYMVTWLLEADGTLSFEGEGGCYTTGAVMPVHHQYAVFMENIIYSDGITEIGSDITSPYANYANVKTVEIGADVKHIYANAMLYPHVTDVYCFAADVPALNTNAFNKTALIANDATLHVVDFSGTLAKYQASSAWNWFPHIVADLPTRKPGTVKVTKVIVDPSVRNIPLTAEELGTKTIQLTAAVYPANATSQEVTWSTSDAGIATVDQNGLVTIVGFDESGEGITITATAKDGSNKKGSCTMSVWDSGQGGDMIPATGIDVNRQSLTLMKSETGIVRVSLTPANSTAYVDATFVTLSETPATLDVMPVYDMESGQRTGEFSITPRELGTFEVTFYTNDYDDHGDPATYPAPSVSMTVNVVEDVFFTENTKEGVPVTYRLIKTDDKLVEVYGDEEQKINVDPNTGIPSVEYIYHTAVDPSTAGTITIPSVVRGYNVVGTGEIAFQNCTQLERVDFCPGIQYVGDRAFEGCTSLREVRLPASLKGLGMNSFAMLTNLKNVHLMATMAPEGLDGMDIWSTAAFLGLSDGGEGATLHVAPGCYSVYNVSPWIEWFTSIVEDGEAVDNFVASYVCDFTKAASKHSAYNDTWTYDTDWSVFGGANNNGQWTYAKFGGKSATLANANPVYVANQYAFGREIKGVRVTFPSGSFGKSGMSCNDWGVKVYSDLACTNLLYTATGEAIAANGCTLTVQPEPGQVWKAGCGIQVYWNLANTSSTNGIVLVDKIEYLTDAEDSRPVWPMYTVRFLNWDGTVLQEGEIREGFLPAYNGETPDRPMDTEYIYTFSGWEPALVAATADADYTAQYSTEERFPGGGTSIEDVQGDKVHSTKVLIDGVLYILRDGKIYNILGTQVR